MAPRHLKRGTRTVPKTVAYIDLTDSPCKRNVSRTFCNNASSEESLASPKKCCLCRVIQEDKAKQDKQRDSLANSACPICLENLEFFSPSAGRQVTSTLCGHLFCQKCITNALKKSRECPSCCRPTKLSDIHPIFMP